MGCLAMVERDGRVVDGLCPKGLSLPFLQDLILTRGDFFGARAIADKMCSIENLEILSEAPACFTSASVLGSGNHAVGFQRRHGLMLSCPF